jgi:hypothetical protein
MTLDITRNSYATNAPVQLAKAAAERNIPVQVIDLPTLTVNIGANGEAVVCNAADAIDITRLAPYLLLGTRGGTVGLLRTSAGTERHLPA